MSGQSCLFEIESAASPGVAFGPSLTLVDISPKEAVGRVAEWHSVLPRCPKFLVRGACFEARGQDGIAVAVAVWSNPVARMLNGRGYYELRRLATSPMAPKNTCSSMIAAMRRVLAGRFQDITYFLSYQDAHAHTGGIYKADNWRIGWVSKRATCAKGSWGVSREGRGEMQSSAPKIAWVKDVVRSCPRERKEVE